MGNATNLSWHRDAPLPVALSIRWVSADSTALEFSWSAAAGNYVAEESSRVKAASGWKPVGLAPPLSADRWLLRVETVAQARFYRVKGR